MMKCLKLFGLFLFMTSNVYAAPFTLIFTSTAEQDDPEHSQRLTQGVVTGDPLKIELVVDNGGETTINQTWEPDDIVSVLITVTTAGGTYTSGTISSANFLASPPPRREGSIKSDINSEIVAVTLNFYSFLGSTVAADSNGSRLTFLGLGELQSSLLHMSNSNTDPFPSPVITGNEYLSMADSFGDIDASHWEIIGLGDCTGDGEIDTSDVLCTKDLILNEDTAVYGADSKVDENITIQDVIETINIILD